MLDNRNTFFTPLIYSICAAVCYVITQFAALQPWILALAALVGIVFLAFTLVMVTEYFVFKSLQAFREIKRAACITPVSIIMENVRGLSTEQIELVYQSQQVIKQRLLPGNAGPVRMFIADDNVQVPQEFVKEFFEKSDAVSLVPVREYNDSKARVYAIALTNMLCSMGLAVPGSGNQRATWAEPVDKVRDYFGV